MNAKSVQSDMNYKQWIITCPNRRLIPEADQAVAASTRIEAEGTMRLYQLRDICSQLHVPLSPTDGSVTRPTFLSHLRSLIFYLLVDMKNKYKNIRQNCVFTSVHCYLLGICYCWFSFQNVPLVLQIWQQRIFSSTSVATAAAYRTLDFSLSFQGTAVSS